MKVLLATSVSHSATERWIPLGLCYIASALIAQGHEVKIFDRYLSSVKGNTQSYANIDTARINEALLKEVESFAPDIVGFNTYTNTIYDTIEAVKALRKSYKGMILLGGHHATALPVLTLERIPEADALIAGEGELPFCMLASDSPRERIPGLYYRENGTIQRSGVKGAAYANLDELPLPAYHLLDMKYYTERNISTIRPYYLATGTLMTARGCHNRCTFCTESLTFSGGVRYHSPQYALENIDLLVKGYKCDGITFLDNNFLADRQHAEEILNGIIQKGFNKNLISCVQVRADDIDADIAKLMRQAGCRKIELGLETGDQESLKRMKKNLSIETSEKAVRILRENGLSVQANLLMGTEGETLEALDATLAWVKRLKVDDFKWGPLLLHPGSVLYNQKGGEFIEKNEWTKENIDGFYKKDHLSDIEPQDREHWCDTKMKPCQRVMHHKGVLRRNTLSLSIRYYADRLKERSRA